MTSNNLADIILRRKTSKILAPVESPVQISKEQWSDFQETLWTAIGLAGWAPFHFDRKLDGIPEPWRVHILPTSRCRELARDFGDWFPDSKPGNLFPGMLRACGALVLVNWIPQTDAEIADPMKRDEVNLEHHAATAAFVQNLLLLFTEQGLATYWSSGGLLKTKTAFERLQIPLQQKMIAAVFVEHPASKEMNLERIDGHLRNKRSSSDLWTRII